jgi:hypothetical protein
MINQKYCPFCRTSAARSCGHLALAAEAREFVRRCVDRCQGQMQWRLLCEQKHHLRHQAREWSPEQEDFMWLETAFCDTFLKHLTWFGGMDYEWRSGPRPEQGGFWVLLWSKDPQRLWWELRDEFERRASSLPVVPDTASSWLIWLSPR